MTVQHTACCAIGLTLLFASTLAGAADAQSGKAFFSKQCSICHVAEPGDSGGAQGPTLIGLLGRHAGRAPGFSYTAAMQAADLTWDPPTLTRFLASPTSVVPGSAMVTAVTREADRDNVVAYFQSLKSIDASASALQPRAPIGVPAASQTSADWRLDAPGRSHRIDLQSLPAPFATSSARNGPSQVPRPANAELALPAGFQMTPFAANLSGPRNMLVAANGDIFVSETGSGRVSVLHPAPDGTQAMSTDVYVQGLEQPSGLAFYPNAKHARWLYIAETARITRYAYRRGDSKPRGTPQIVSAAIPGGGGHRTRDIVFSPDGKRLFVSVGSASNIADKMPKRSPTEIRTWEAGHGLGAAWGDETGRAAVLVLSPAPPTTPKTFATGLRNCVGLTLQAATGSLWCTVNERDLLGDDLVPDYSTRLHAGGFYGWPWYYMGAHEDPRLKGDRPDLAGKVSIPDVPYQSHSAPLSLTFYAASSGASAFPKDYIGDAFAAFHGSWNRSLRTGYKLVRVLFKDGQPTGEYQDFLTGFIAEDGNVWGRPVATAQLADGSLLVSDDAGSVVYRISYSAL